MSVGAGNVTLADLANQLQELRAASDAWWLLINGVLVFFMQCGFGYASSCASNPKPVPADCKVCSRAVRSMLEAGVVTARSTQNILLKNLLDTSLGGIVWWAAGHAIAYGHGNSFIGTVGESNLFFSISQEMTDSAAGDSILEGSGTPAKTFALWWFQFTFASVAATIVSGAVAERANLLAYLTYSTMITLLVYPVVAHWVWSTSGWLNLQNPDAVFGGVIDFAGSGVVHVTGGVAALCGASIIGPRRGRFAKAPEHVERCRRAMPMPMPGHSTVLQALGTFILWMGW